MLISALKKTTLLDYPDKIATIIFTAWCNLRCGFCHNREFVLPEEIKKITDFIPEEIFFNFLKTKVWVLDWVVICWWEPTINRDLFDFCKKIKDLWFLVKIDTNWQNPKVIEKLLDDKLVDYIAMDIKNSFSKYEITTGVREDIDEYRKSIELIKDSKIDYEFRTTLVKWFHSIEDVIEIAKLISWTKKYFLQNFKWGSTLDENFSWTSFSRAELHEFEKACKKYVENVHIREYDE